MIEYKIKKETYIKYFGEQWAELLYNNLLDTTIMDRIYNKLLDYRNLGFETIPNKDLRFQIFKQIQPKDINCVIIAGSPYDQSENTGEVALALPEQRVKLNHTTPTLEVIEQELQQCYGYDKDLDKTMSNWVNQGVFVINSQLSININDGNEENIWYDFMSKMLKQLSSEYSNIPFLLWGNQAKALKYSIHKNNNHLVLENSNPIDESYKLNSFCGKKHFIIVNNYLNSINKNKINWAL